MKEHKRRALPALTVRDRVALDLRELQRCVRHPIGPFLSVCANARLMIGPEPESDRAQFTMSVCESLMRGTGEQQSSPRSCDALSHESITPTMIKWPRQIAPL
jgi:hypothetical protein